MQLVKEREKNNMMELKLQLLGGRGASSSNNGKSTFESLINKRESMKYAVTFGTGIDVSEKRGNLSSITSYRIGQLENVMKNIDETVIQVQQGSYDKRINQLKELGYNVISRTQPGSNDKTATILAHIKRRK